MTLVIKENTRYKVHRIDSVNTVKGQPKTVHPYSKVIKEADFLGSSAPGVDSLADPNYVIGGGGPLTYKGLHPDRAMMEARCFTKIASLVHSETMSWGLAMAEYRETLKMASSIFTAVRNPLRTVAEGLETYVKKSTRKNPAWLVWINQPRNLRGAMPPKYTWDKGAAPLHFLDQVTSAHLAWKFGVVPLMTDLDTALKAMAKDRFSEERIVVSGGKHRWATRYSDAPGIYGADIELQGKERCKGGARFTLSNEDVYLAQELGLLNLPAIVLDAVPLSFVVNWWWPVVTWSQQLTALAGVSAVDAWTTYRTEGTWCKKYRTVNFQNMYGNKGRAFLMQRTPVLPKSMKFPTSVRVAQDKDGGKTLTLVELAAQKILPLLERIKHANHG